MGKVGKQELGLGCVKKKRDKYDKGIGIGRALEKCVDMDEDYADFLVVFINYAQQKEAGVAAYGGDKPSSSDVEEDDPHYMAFLANTKPHGESYVFTTTDQNGLPVVVEFEKDRELEIHRVEKGRQGNELATKNRIVEKEKVKDGIFFSKKRRNEDRDLDNRKHRVDVKFVSDKEQKIQNDSKFMDVEVKIEPKEDYNALKEAISESEVEILENVGIGKGSFFNPFEPSVQHLDATIIDSGYRKECLNLLMRPYDEEEYKKLWKDIKIQLPSSSTNERGKSLLSLHKAVNRAIKRTNHDKDKKLNIMRGFFFWLEHLTRQDAFQPWKDAECLQTMPGSS